MNTRSSQIEAPFQLIRTYVSDLSTHNSCLESNIGSDGERKIDVSYEISHEGNTESGDHFAVLSLTISIETNTDDGQLDLDMTIHGIFTASSTEISEETFEKMLRINGCSSLYSVARGIISSVSSQLFTGGNIIIPLVNFVRFREIEDEN